MGVFRGWKWDRQTELPFARVAPASVPTRGVTEGVGKREGRQKAKSEAFKDKGSKRLSGKEGVEGEKKRRRNGREGHV